MIVGQDDVIEQVLIAIFARGHALLEGVPGLAKTLLISSLAQVAAPDVQADPVHARPDAQRRDRHGGHPGRPGNRRQRAYKFLPGPLFANMLLADEINRTPPKTQAAMLEAMQERQVRAGGKMHTLPAPFFVLATQNPLEQEGTYPLPEAQLDRFLLYIKVDYPSGGRGMGDRPPRDDRPAWARSSRSCRGDDIIEMQKLVTRVPVSDQVLGYAWALVRASRPGHARSARLRQHVGELGRRPARRADAGHLRQGPRDPLRPLPRHRRRRASRRQAGPAAPHRRQLRRPGRQRRQREADRHADGSRAGRSEVRETGRVRQWLRD